MQIWKSLGNIFKPIQFNWSKTHCMLPTVYKFDNNRARIFFGSRNSKNISSIGYLDLAYKNGCIKVLNYSKKPILKPGLLGTFDDNGVLPSSIIKKVKSILCFI